MLAELVPSGVARLRAELPACGLELAAFAAQAAGELAGEPLAGVVARAVERVSDVLFEPVWGRSDTDERLRQRGTRHAAPPRQLVCARLQGGSEGGDQPPAFFGVLPGWRGGRSVDVVEDDVCIGLNIVVGASEGEQRLRPQEVLPPLDPESVDDVEGVSDGEVVQP
ncbi:hypothetical protein AB0L05_27655 [Nonomuraea pusilla]|uniref:hypothetical protein n=1 Tax=Nonomuraea pusilla TaxID=46177 RepID=UPI003427E8CC